MDGGNKETPNYHYGSVVTPFHKEGQTNDALVGIWRSRAHRARLWFWWLTAINGVLLLLVLALLSVSPVQLMVAEMLPSGYVTQVGQLPVKTMSDQEFTQQYGHSQRAEKRNAQ